MNKQVYYIWVSEQNNGNDISEIEAEKIYNKAIDSGMQVLNIESSEYPDSLRMIDKPPLVLYCYGNINLLKDLCIGIVGTRRASPYGKWVTAEIAKALVRCGATHVSGMAEGIDSAGHKAVLEAGGKSIAVLGTGIDVCFPKSSKLIYDELKQNGLIISEYSPGTVGRPWNFPARNRIISALAEKLVVVEGALRSGSLITAKIALNQGKDLYAVPGNINQPNSIGPNCLIEDGAIPIVNPTEIAETLGIGSFPKLRAESELCGLQKEIYELVSVSGSISVEDIVNCLNSSIEKILAELTMLELQGFLNIDGSIVHL